MIEGFKPMLASEVDLAKLQYPVIASPKLDGVRAIVIDGVVLSRSLKKIPNEYVQGLLSEFNGFDGELIVGDPRSPTVYRDTVSGVMSVAGTPDVRLFYFDNVLFPDLSYSERMSLISKVSGTNIHVVRHRDAMIRDEEQLLRFEQECLDEGYEGLILRKPDGHYKFGRSTAKEGLLLKLKRFTDAEFEVVGFEERQHNGNEASVNELGRTKRSSHKAGKSGRGDLGALVVRRREDGHVFNVGTGFDDSLRSEIWSNQRAYLGRLAKVKYFAIGMKDAPRHPVFLGFRDERDV